MEDVKDTTASDQPTGGENPTAGTSAPRALATGNATPASAQTETPQQEFDRLAARKEELDKQIRHKPPEIRELSPEQNEINQIDARLMDLWKTHTLVRKEDK